MKALVCFVGADGNPEPAYIKGKAVKWDELNLVLPEALENLNVTLVSYVT
jgi:hypothetical protein